MGSNSERDFASPLRDPSQVDSIYAERKQNLVRVSVGVIHELPLRKGKLDLEFF